MKIETYLTILQKEKETLQAFNCAIRLLSGVAGLLSEGRNAHQSLVDQRDRLERSIASHRRIIALLEKRESKSEASR